jgi:hypothetical protein
MITIKKNNVRWGKKKKKGGQVIATVGVEI